MVEDSVTEEGREAALALGSQRVPARTRYRIRRPV